MTTHYAVFNEVTGVITRWGDCAPDEVAVQAGPGEQVLEVLGPVDPARQRVDLVTRELVDYLPDKPADTPLATWHLQGGRWVAVPTFEGERASVLATLRARIKSLEAGTDRALRLFVLEAVDHPAAARMQAIEDAVEPLRDLVRQAAAAADATALEPIALAARTYGPAT